ncbi:MAG: PTS fructose transporter subunit IIABC [Coriobacteriales bacterium]|jgi:PTS system fructose-specific IIC component
MRIVDLLKPESIEIGAHPDDKAGAIEELIALHEKAGSLSDVEGYRKAILAREESGTTAIGEGMAIPHAKTAAVDHPALAAMTVPDGVDYDAPDGKPSTLIFMIAAPADGADVHLEVLSRLMTMLMDLDFRAKLQNASSPEEFLETIDAMEREKFAEEEPEEEGKKEEPAQQDNDRIRVLAVTACPTGIAHTYMAAEALEQQGAKMGVSIKVETNGSGGAKHVLEPDEIASCDGIIVAADKKVEMARFEGRPVLITKVADGINKPEELIQSVLDGKAPIYHHKGEAGEADTQDEGATESAGRKVYKQLMDGVSHMLPFVVAGGIFIALAFLIDGILGVPQDSNFGSGTPFTAWLKTMGNFSFNFMVPILAAFIARAIADRPGLLVGFVGGWMATLGCNFLVPAGTGADAATLSALTGTIWYPVPSGFLGGLLAGFAGGYLMLGIEKLCEHMPQSIEGIKQILIFPLAGLAAITIVMCAVGPVMGAINTGMTNGLNWLALNNFGVILGLLLAMMMAIDMGGPFNKAAYVFGTGMLVTAAGTTDPVTQNNCYQIMACVMIGGMVPPLAIALSTSFFKNRWTPSEIKNGPVNYIMGLSFITEGAIPYAAADPLRVIPSCMVGSAVAGALCWIFGCTLMAPHGGIFVFPVVGNWPLYLVALVVGSLVGMLMLALLKKKQPVEEAQE